jgi:hypothetical protein
LADVLDLVVGVEVFDVVADGDGCRSPGEGEGVLAYIGCVNRRKWERRLEGEMQRKLQGSGARRFHMGNRGGLKEGGWLREWGG